MSKFEKTDKEILKAFAILLERQGSIKKITVASLARETGITRATFYAHYNNIHEVSTAYEKQMLEALDFGKLNVFNSKEATKFFNRFFDFLADNEEIYHHLLMNDVAFAHLQNINRKFCDQLLGNLRPGLSRRKLRELELNVRFFVDGSVYLIARYFRGETQLSLSEIKKYLSKKFKSLSF